MVITNVLYKLFILYHPNATLLLFLIFDTFQDVAVYLTLNEEKITLNEEHGTRNTEHRTRNATRFTTLHLAFLYLSEVLRKLYPGNAEVLR